MLNWLLQPLTWLLSHRPDWGDALGRWLLRTGNRFYVLLAVVFALAGASDQFVHRINSALSNASFDWLMLHRPIPYPADPGLVVIDIDEASLAALSAQYGRWPWPRQVLAQVAGSLESVGAQAVVFDILFADPDVANPASEQAFDRYVAGSAHSFYPIGRLNPDNDTRSQVTLAMLNFAHPDPSAAPGQLHPGRTIAVLPPYFKSIYDSTRVGTHNIYPDADNVVRWYRNFEPLGGYRIPSLPYRMAEVLGWPRPAQSRSLINWPRGRTPYRTYSFADVLRAVQGNQGSLLEQFRHKLVLIGSTAPSLNDLKATPVDRLESGIYVLATAIDNTRHARFLHPLTPVGIWLLELLMLAASAWLCHDQRHAFTITKYFFIVPTVLLGISLLSVSVSDLLVDLSVPAAMVLGYFTIAKLYDSQRRDYVAGTGVFAPARQGRLQIACLPASLDYRQVLGVLQQQGSAVRLWQSAEAGLGEDWQRQGWVLWRWQRADVAAATAPPASEAAALQWFEVGAESDPQDAPELARTIAQALESMRRTSQESRDLPFHTDKG